MGKKRIILILSFVAFVSVIYTLNDPRFPAHAGTSYLDLPVKGMVTMVDVGAGSCIPCKMMAPILEKLEKRYRKKASIVFVDLRYQREAGQHFGIEAIPTQVFYDKNGKEVFRHIGFMSEEAIVAQLAAMGVK